jgi:hypothetical protein
VVPSFQDWPFPHGEVPDSWPFPAGNAHILGRDRCVLTSQALGCKRAHVVPKDEATWFETNAMATYAPGHDVDSDGNLIRLRADIHKVYDALQLVIVPKKEIYAPGNDTGSAVYVVHVVDSGASEFWALYHNVPLQNIEHTAREYHLARFAIAVIEGVKGFLLQGHPRKVIRIEGGGDPRTVVLSGTELKDLYGGGGSNASSPVCSRDRRHEEGVDSDISSRMETEDGCEEDEERRGRPLIKTWRAKEEAFPRRMLR